jgi:hypothetical protein
LTGPCSKFILKGCARVRRKRLDVLVLICLASEQRFKLVRLLSEYSTPLGIVGLQPRNLLMAAVFGEWKPPRANETHGSSDASLAQIFSKTT